MRLIGDVDKYQHVERFGSREVEGLLQGTCVIQEKLDGANLTVANVGGLTISTRNQCIHHDGSPETGFQGAVEYVLKHEGIKQFMPDHPGLILRGEWLVKNKIDYGPSNHFKYYVFDVQRFDGSYLPLSEYIGLLTEYEILMVPYIGQLANGDIAEIERVAQGPSALGAERKEGVVVKRYDFVNEFGRTVWGKFVNEEFIQQKRVKTNSEMEQLFADKFATEFFVGKIVAKLEGDVSIKRMGEVIGRAWYEIVHEEIPDFVLKNKVKTFDFYAARRFVTENVRKIALKELVS